MKLLLFFTILILIILILYIPIPWTAGPISWKLKDHVKNGYIKWRHKVLNKPLNKKVCKENLETLSKILNDNKIVFWLSEGTALGARREGDFIDHDDDVDIGIWYKDFYKFKNLIPLINKRDFTIDYYFNSNRPHTSKLMGLSRKNEKIDIDFTSDLYCQACVTKRANCKTCDKLLECLKNMSYIDFLGNKYLCPDTDYLEYMYGPDWKTPRKEKFTI